VELVTDYLEGALSGRERARFEAHLRDCPHCAEYLRQIRTTIEVTGKVTPRSLAPKARRELVALYREWTAG
jgi:anti-sigma factor RsiW